MKRRERAKREEEGVKIWRKESAAEGVIRAIEEKPEEVEGDVGERLIRRQEVGGRGEESRKGGQVKCRQTT